MATLHGVRRSKLVPDAISGHFFVNRIMCLSSTTACERFRVFNIFFPFVTPLFLSFSFARVHMIDTFDVEGHTTNMTTRRKSRLVKWNKVCFGEL